MKVLFLVLLSLCSQISWAENYQSTDKRISLLELYTSEGCSSCPPAEKWLGNIYENGFEADTVIPLAFHVTYWDYLGWKDRFSQLQFDQRQRTMVSREGGKTVYTPQFFVNGGTVKDPDRLTQYLNTRHKFKAKTKIQVALEQNDGSLALQVMLDKTGDQLLASQPITVFVTSYQNNIESLITAGENRGLKSKHQYVVQQMEYTRYMGKPLSFQMSLAQGMQPDQGGLVIFAEQAGEVLQVLHIPFSEQTIKKRA